jgi:hypothetical protein
MNKIIILLVVSIISIQAATTDALEGYVFGLSYHSNRAIDYNEVNPGLGFGYVHKTENNFNNNFDAYFTVIGGAYKDSYNEDATFLMPGFRFGFGNEKGLHQTIGVNGGYFKGSDMIGIGVMPSASIGYNRFDVCFTGNPFFCKPTEENVSSDPKKNRGATGGFVAVFLKIRLMEW